MDGFGLCSNSLNYSSSRMVDKCGSLLLSVFWFRDAGCCCVSLSEACRESLSRLEVEELWASFSEGTFMLMFRLMLMFMFEMKMLLSVPG